MTQLNKKNFFAKLGILHREKVTLAGLGEVYVKALTVKEGEEFERLAYNTDGQFKDDTSAKSLMVIMTVEDEGGNKLFNLDDLEQLTSMPAAPINKLFSAAMKLNSITENDIEELKKN